MTPETTPLRLNLKKDEKLEVEWKDGLRSEYPVAMLRAMCPCASCKKTREEEQAAKAKKKPLLRVLAGNPEERPLAVVAAELVGGYAIRLDWSDNHGSGIYSFDYLREISPQKK